MGEKKKKAPSNIFWGIMAIRDKDLVWCGRGQLLLWNLLGFVSPFHLRRQLHLRMYYVAVFYLKGISKNYTFFFVNIFGLNFQLKSFSKSFDEGVVSIL